MIDHLKGSIVKFELCFDKTHENICIFKTSSYQDISINYVLFPRMKMDICRLFWLSVKLEFSVTNLTVTSQCLLHALQRRKNQVTWHQDVHM